MPERSADEFLRYFLALLNDVETVFGVGYANTLEVVVFNRSVFVFNNDVSNTGLSVFVPLLEFDVGPGMPVLSGRVFVLTDTDPYFCRSGEFEFNILTIELGVSNESSSRFAFLAGVIPAVNDIACFICRNNLSAVSSYAGFIVGHSGIIAVVEFPAVFDTDTLVGSGIKFTKIFFPVKALGLGCVERNIKICIVGGIVVVIFLVVEIIFGRLAINKFPFTLATYILTIEVTCAAITEESNGAETVFTGRKIDLLANIVRRSISLTVYTALLVHVRSFVATGAIYTVPCSFDIETFVEACILDFGSHIFRTLIQAEIVEAAPFVGIAAFVHYTDYHVATGVADSDFVEIFTGCKSSGSFTCTVGSGIAAGEKTFDDLLFAIDVDIGIVKSTIGHIGLREVVVTTAIESIYLEGILTGFHIGKSLIKIESTVPYFAYAVGGCCKSTLPSGKICGIGYVLAGYRRRPKQLWLRHRAAERCV